jgi:hypothetical protein
MRFKKWRNRPGCEVQGAGCGVHRYPVHHTRCVPSFPPRARTRAYLIEGGCPLGGWGWMISEPRRKHSAGKTEFQEKS